MTGLVAEKLSRQWASQKLPVRPGAGSEALRQFEATHKVVLPPDMRDYFRKHDGMQLDPPNDKDAEGFSFWPLSRIRRAAEELADAVPPAEAAPELDHYFAFADYLDLSWTYAIRLTADPRDSNRVINIGTDPPTEVASSFAEFVDLYLQNSPRLYAQKDA